MPGTWSIQQIVIHMMDSDLIGADRMKRVAAEDRVPTLSATTNGLCRNHCSIDELDPQAACEVFEKNRRMTAEVLKRLPEAAFERDGRSQRARASDDPGRVFETYVGHLRPSPEVHPREAKHAGQVGRARARIEPR